MKRIEDVRRLPIMHRMETAEVSLVKRDASDKESPTLYEISVSSETEVARWFGIEILDHSSGAVDMSRMNNGAAVLVDHFSDQVGVVEKSRLDEKARKLRASVRFSKSDRGQEIEQDVADGIRRNVSVGYRVVSMKQVEVRDGGVPVYKVTRWIPLEVSIVGVPADSSVGVNRSEGGEDFPIELEDGAASAVKEERMLHRSVKLDGGGAGGNGGGAEQRTEPERPAGNTTVVVRDNRADIVEIMEMCEANGLSARADRKSVV